MLLTWLDARFDRFWSFVLHKLMKHFQGSNLDFSRRAFIVSTLTCVASAQVCLGIPMMLGIFLWFMPLIRQLQAARYQGVAIVAVTKQIVMVLTVVRLITIILALMMLVTLPSDPYWVADLSFIVSLSCYSAACYFIHHTHPSCTPGPST